MPTSGDPCSRVSYSAMRPRNSASTRPIDSVEALCQPPQPLAQRHERHQRLRQRGVDVDRVGHDGAREGGAHLLGRVDARAVLRLAVEAPRCGVTTTSSRWKIE